MPQLRNLELEGRNLKKEVGRAIISLGPGKIVEEVEKRQFGF